MVRITRVRSAFTLVELLVAMAVIIALASITLLVVPGVLDQDRTTDGATRVRQALMLSKAQAARDGLPRGVRFIVSPTLDPNNPAKTSTLFVTELQYVEAPQPVIPNPYMLSDPTLDPHIRLQYVLNPNGQITSRICTVVNLTYDQATLIVKGSIIALPEFGGVFIRVAENVVPQPQTGLTPPVNAPGKFMVRFTLDTAANLNQLAAFPDAELGGAGTTVIYGFAIYPAARPLLGESIITLPKNVCVDLNQYVSQPPGVAGLDYEILFTPTGQVLPTSSFLTGGSPGASGQIFLWVRDYTKVPDMSPQLPLTNPRVYQIDRFRQGGEQQIVAVKTRSGALGVFPVLWPGPAGTYIAGQDPYTLARQGANGQ